VGSPTDVDHSGSQRITMLSVRSVMSVFARRVRLTDTCEQDQKWTREFLCTERSDKYLVCFACVLCCACVLGTFRVGSDLLEVQVCFRFGSSLVHVLWSSGSTGSFRHGRLARRTWNPHVWEDCTVHMSAVPQVVRLCAVRLHVTYMLQMSPFSKS